MVLKEGDKYLSVSVSVGEALFQCHKAIGEGKDKITLAAFKNEKGGINNAPEWHSQFIGVWEKIKGENKKND